MSRCAPVDYQSVCQKVKLGESEYNLSYKMEMIRRLVIAIWKNLEMSLYHRNTKKKIGFL